MSDLALESVAWVLLLVDRSGSMWSIRDATLSGLKHFVKEQGADPVVRLSVVQFGTDRQGRLELTTMFDTAATRSEARALEKAEYEPSGDTPLLAAVLAAIARMEKLVRSQDRALLVIQTDGHENASPKHITLEHVRARITAKIAEGNWTFAYLGAHLDEWHRPPREQDFGLDPRHVLGWSPTGQGVTAAYATTSDAVTRWKGDRRLAGFFPLQLPPPR